MTQHDLTIADGKGQPVRLDIQAALQALATMSSGTTAPATPYPGQLWLDTTVTPNGQLRMRDLANATWIAIAGFPVKASSAEAIAATDDTKYVTPKGLHDRGLATPQLLRNRIVNGAMQVSQENGDALGTTSNYWPADQWRVNYSVSPGALSSQRVASVTPRGSIYRLRIIVTTAKAALAAGDWVGLIQGIEGLRIADLKLGTPAARGMILRFGFKGPAGKYYVSLRNNPIGFSNVQPFTVSAGQANTDIEVILRYEPATVGTWITDNTKGFEAFFTLDSGSTFMGTVDGWQAGNVIAKSDQFKGMATIGNTFDLFDVGLYPDDGSGHPPAWEMPDPYEELRVCQRYWVGGVITYYNALSAVANHYALGYMPCDMRVAPTISGTNLSNSNFPATVGTSLLTTQVPRSIREARAATSAARGWFVTSWDCSARV